MSKPSTLTSQEKFIKDNNIERAEPGVDALKEQGVDVLSPQQYEAHQHPVRSSLENVGRGFASDFINLANITPPVLLTRELAKHGYLHGSGKIPQIPGGDPHSLSYGLGEMGGALIPFGGVDMLLEKIASKSPRVASAILKNPYVKSILSGGLVSAGIAPEGQRTEAGALGAAFGGAGQGVSDLFKGLGGGKIKAAAAQKLASLVQPYLGKVDNPTGDTANAIVNSYKDFKGISDSNYHKIFDGLSGHKIGIEDLPQYEKTYSNMFKPPSDATTPDDLLKEMGGRSVRGLAGLEKKGLSPNRVNEIRSELLNEVRDNKIKNESAVARKYSHLADALHGDLQNYFKKIDPALLEKYRGAQDFYRNNIVPFHEHPQSKKILTALKSNNALDNLGDTDDFTRLGGELKSSQFIPSPGSKDVKRLNMLSPIVRDIEHDPLGDYTAAQLGKGMVFEKAAPDKEGEFDIKKYLKIYKGLGEKQKNFLFSNPEQHILNTLKDYHTTKDEEKKLIPALFKGVGSVLGGAALAGTVGGRLGMGELVPALVGGGAAALKSKAISQGMINMIGKLLPEDMSKLTAILNKSGAQGAPTKIIKQLATASAVPFSSS